MQMYAPEFRKTIFFPSPVKHPRFKRAFDVAFSLTVLALCLPLLLLVAAGVALTSRGPIFFNALRIGKRGKIIYCTKFRSMYVDADSKFKKLIRSSPAAKNEWETFKKLKNDPRVTPLGKFLRKTSLDELPQFWNVLKGDLSVVGPRPFYLEEILRYFDGRAGKILSVKPGITGLWQTSGRNHLSIRQRIALDEAYIEKHSLGLDLALIMKTIPAILFPKGAF